MSTDIEVRLSPEDQSQLVRDVKGFDRTLSTAVRTRIRKIAAPAASSALDRALQDVPQHGGLRARIAARAKIGISTTTGRAAGVKIIYRQPRALRDIDRGLIRHPVFARGARADWVWVTQRTRPGQLTSAVEAEGRQVEAAIEQALRDAAATITAGRVTT